MNIGLQISRPGKSAESLDDKDQSFSSKFTSPKILFEGALTFAFGNGDTSKAVTIPHGLGFPPTFNVYAEVNDSNEMWQHFQSAGFFPGVAPVREIEATADSYNLTVTMYRGSGLGPANHRGYYYIFMDIPIKNISKKYKSDKVGIKISPPGIDAEQAGDVQLSLHSGYKTLKVLKEYDFSLTFSGTSAITVRIPHGLGYWPAFEVGMRTANNSRLFPLPYMVNSDAALYAFVTQDEVVIKAQPAVDPGSLTVQGKALIFYDRIA